MHENQISKLIVDCAIEVHRTLGGPGLTENVYIEPFCWELSQRGLTAEREVAVPIVYKGRTLGNPLRLDILINKLVIVECKSIAVYNPIFETQLLTYLRLLNLKLGLVVNFGEQRVIDGIHRVANGLEDAIIPQRS
jgi:GxxExxY protein